MKGSSCRSDDQEVPEADRATRTTPSGFAGAAKLKPSLLNEVQVGCRLPQHARIGFPGTISTSA